MKRILAIAFGICFVLALMSAPASIAEDPAHNYIGVQKCKMCHNSKAKGAQFTHWSEAAHSRAFATLGGDKAKEIAAAKGIEDPQKASECLQCHVTGHGAPAAKLTGKYRVKDGVGCESCHGPGGDYWKMSIMKDQAKSVAAGLIIPNEATCTTCHNEKSPTFKGFDYATYYAKIAHPNPQSAGSK